MMAYRTPEWSPARPDVTATAYIATSYKSVIDGCDAKFEFVENDVLGARWHWHVSLDMMHVSGCARGVADAFDAAERAADIICRWPAHLQWRSAS